MREAEEKEDGRAGSWVLKPGAWTVDEAGRAVRPAVLESLPYYFDPNIFTNTLKE